MKSRPLQSTPSVCLFVGLILVISSCTPTRIAPSAYTLLVKQCNVSSVNLWPLDFLVEVYYFPPETNLDDAYDEVICERFSPSETFVLKPEDFDLTGNFQLALKPDQVVILFFHQTGFPGLHAETQLETTHGGSGETCIEFKQ